jgi:hypothetical protein
MHYFVKKELGSDFPATRRFYLVCSTIRSSFRDNSLVEDNTSKEFIAYLISLKVLGVVLKILCI